MTWRDVYIEFPIATTADPLAGNSATVQLPPSCKTVSGVELVGYRVANYSGRETNRRADNLVLEIKELPPSELISNLPQHDRVFTVLGIHEIPTTNIYTNREVFASQFFRPQKIAQLTFKVYQTFPFTDWTGADTRIDFQGTNPQVATDSATPQFHPNIQLWLRILVNQESTYSK